MKRGVLICLAAIAVALMIISGAHAGGYKAPTAGQSPHGDYSDATDKCKVCHAVHNAASSDSKLGGGTQALLRSERGIPDGTPLETPDSGNPCVYCHIVGDWAIAKVYGGVLANYTQDSRYNHDDAHRWFHGQKNYAGCMSCHSVHGSDVLAGYETEIVSANPNPDWNAISVTDLTTFCRDCHEDTSQASGRWGRRCGTCHFDDGSGSPMTRGGTDLVDWADNLPPFYTQDRNGTSHIMTTTLTGNYGTQVAWAKSSECRDCHSGGNHTTSNNFPHYTSGAYFLDDDFRPTDGYYPPDSGMDRVCLNCHVEGGNGGAYTTGVGKTF